MNRLPPELIALCATFVSCTDPRPIVTLTHVCRYWYRSITSGQRNWASIGSGWKRLVPLCLERAGSVPLTVKISAPDIARDEGFLQALIPHVSRISDLSLTGYSSMKNAEDKLPGFFSPMPNLTSLELGQTEWLAKSFPLDETPTLPILQNVSKLKSLHLTRVPLYSTLFHIQSLVELKLTDYTIPFGKFVGFLEPNVALEIVILRLSFIKGSVWTVPERTVSLPRLRYLALSFDYENGIGARGLFSCLSFPRTAFVEVHVVSSPRGSDFFLASFLPHPPTSIHELLAHTTTIKYQDSPREVHISGNGGSFSFYTPITPSKIYEEFDPFTTSAVRELHLRPNRIDRKDLASHLPQALEQLPMLEALALSQASLCPGSLSALSKEPLLCRSLKTIALIECPGTRDVITELEEIATKREHSTLARLHRVVIVNDRYELPDSRSIKNLRRLVPHVDVMVGDELPDLL